MGKNYLKVSKQGLILLFPKKGIFYPNSFESYLISLLESFIFGYSPINLGGGSKNKLYYILWKTFEVIASTIYTLFERTL